MGAANPPAIALALIWPKDHRDFQLCRNDRRVHVGTYQPPGGVDRLLMPREDGAHRPNLRRIEADLTRHRGYEGGIRSGRRRLRRQPDAICDDADGEAEEGRSGERPEGPAPRTHRPETSLPSEAMTFTGNTVTILIKSLSASFDTYDPDTRI